MANDTYLSLAETTEGEFKDRGSKFIAYARLVRSEEECKAFLEEIKELHFKARHHCYGYRLGRAGKRFRANDDGEPSGTAGRPILGQLDSFGLSNAMAIVVRYFGGTKLGTSGLRNAYKEATRYALEAGKIEKFVIEHLYELSFHYAKMPEIMNQVKGADFEIIETGFDANPSLQIAVREDRVEEMKDLLKPLGELKYLGERE